MSFERPNGPTFFGDKDTLPTGNGDKVIKGSEVDADFNAISTEVNNISAGVDSINGEINNINAELEAIRDDFGGVSDNIPGVEFGDGDGELLSWSKPENKWVKTDTMKVQPGDKEIIARGNIVTQPMLMNQSTQTEIGYVNGHAGMLYRCERYENANDPWSGINGLNWEVGYVRPRDDQTDPKRKNGFDVVADRFTARITRDYQGNWWETEIVFRADGDELELGSRKNPQTVRVNGALTCTNSTELGNDNSDQHVFHGDVYVGYTDPDNVPDTAKGDTVPGTLFSSRGIKLVKDPADSTPHEPSFNCGGHKIVQLAPATSNDQAPNWGQVRNLLRSTIIDAVQASDDFESFKANVVEALGEL